MKKTVKKAIEAAQKLLADLIRPDGHEELSTPDEVAEFGLLFQGMPVGVLSLKKGVWSFKYSIEFKRQSRIKPLPEFPDMDKVYQSKNLWPFFAFRIPGMNQPIAKELVEKKGIKEGNIVKLLDLFGKKSINNPFELELMDH